MTLIYVRRQPRRQIFVAECSATGPATNFLDTDENQHKKYSKENEEARYNDLISALTCKYIFIRFNPDSYTNKKNRNANPMIGTRLKRLQEEIDKQILRIEQEQNNELLEVIELYYDNFN